MFATPRGFIINDEIPSLAPLKHGRPPDIVPRPVAVIVAAILVILVLGACSSSSKTTPAPTSASPAVSSPSAAGVPATSAGAAQAASVIMIKDFKYTTPASVDAGSMLSVMNADSQNHTVTADSTNAFDVVATAGKTVTFTAPKTPGRYPFHCTYHSNMLGVLIVK